MILFLLAAVLAAPAAAFPVRVYYRPSGGVIVFQAIMCNPGESKQACLVRVAARDCPKDDAGACLPHDDMDSEQLPERSTRNKWRGSKASGLRIDAAYKTQKERINEATQDLEDELAKPNPDAIKTIKAQRKLEKARREKDRP